MDMSLRGGGVVHLTGVYSVPQLMLDPPQEVPQGMFDTDSERSHTWCYLQHDICIEESSTCGQTSRSEVARVGVTHIPTSRWPNADCMR